MSAAAPSSRITTRQLAARKGGVPIVALTAYSTPVARALDSHCDLILVGDSLGMVLYGLPTTLGVSVDMMIAHGAAVMRGANRACVIVDLPFGSYQVSPEQAFATAARIMSDTGCGGVKLEGGVEMASTVDFLVKRGVPVLGHVGLTPQSVHRLGGFRIQGRGSTEAAGLEADGRAIANAGAFAIVVEGTVEPLARDLTNLLPIPTIGIGASAACDGQILVTDDVIGLFPDFLPRFAKRYADVGASIAQAVATYAEEVRSRMFPSEQHTFK